MHGHIDLPPEILLSLIILDRQLSGVQTNEETIRFVGLFEAVTPWCCLCTQISSNHRH